MAGVLSKSHLKVPSSQRDDSYSSSQRNDSHGTFHMTKKTKEYIIPTLKERAEKEAINLSKRVLKRREQKRAPLQNPPQVRKENENTEIEQDIGENIEEMDEDAIIT